MNLSEVSIRRPVLATVISLVLLLFGAVSFVFLGVREYPAVDPPIVTVTTQYPGASPAVIGSQITEPLEQQINGIDGIRVLSSTSSEERSQIRVEFQVGADLEAAANDVRDRVSRAIRNLPPDADPPVVEKSDADSEPILFLIVKSATRPILEVNDFADRVVRERIQTIPGVSNVRIFGEKRYAMRLWLDPRKLAAHGLTPLDVQTALVAENVDLPSGRLEGDTVELSLRTAGRLTTEADFDAMILRRDNGRQVELRDVGWSELGPQNMRTGIKEDGVLVVGLAVIPQPNTNAIAVADELYVRLEEIRRSAPADITIEIGYDFTRFVRRSITEVEETIGIAFCLVAAIIYLFLRSWRSTLIPVLAIPVSIVAAFFVMFLAGFSINVLTLVGIVLAIGLVCDDAIVVLENVYAKIERGSAPLEAAIEGSREIYFAVISTTVTLAAVFMPILFLQGLTGRLFREFGIVVMGAVLVSALVALTLSPMMCRYLLSEHGEGGRFHRATQRYFDALDAGYRRTLAAFLERRAAAAAVVAGAVALIALCWPLLPSELAPFEDRSNIRVNLRAPEGASFEFTQFQMDRIALYLAEAVPELDRTLAIAAPGSSGGSVNTGLFNLYLSDPELRARSQGGGVPAGRARPRGLHVGARLSRAAADGRRPPLGAARPVRAPGGHARRSPRGAAGLPRSRDGEPGAPLRRRGPEGEPAGGLDPHRPRSRGGARRLRAGRREDAPARLWRAALRLLPEERPPVRRHRSGRPRRSERAGGPLEPLRPRGGRRDGLARQPRALRRDGRAGRDLPLQPLHVRDDLGRPRARHDDRRRSRRIRRDPRRAPAPGDPHQPGGTVARLRGCRLQPALRLRLRARADLPDAGRAVRELPRSADHPRDRPALDRRRPPRAPGVRPDPERVQPDRPDHADRPRHQERHPDRRVREPAPERGECARTAVLEASAARLRPILMTSAATFFGVLPIALSLGGAAGSRQSLGIAVAGGLLFSTVLTLYVVPVVYDALAGRAAHAPLPDAAPERTGVGALP